MTLKVELISNNGAIINLVQVSDVFTKSFPLQMGGSTIYTENDWTFMVGRSFMINLRTKFVLLPLHPNKEKDTLYFDNDNDRKEALKDFHTALLQWSGDKVFNNKPLFSKTPNIKYHKNIWIIF